MTEIRFRKMSEYDAGKKILTGLLIILFFAVLVSEVCAETPHSDFTSNIISGEAPLIVHFSDNSSVSDGYTIFSWNWSFGDGDTSLDQNPSHEYWGTGCYDVALTIDYGNGTDTALKQSYISVSQPFQSPVADFSADPSSGPAPLVVFFTDFSTGPIERWDWDFGDGSPHSSEQYPTHEYLDSGTFNITLTVGNFYESHTLTLPDLILVNEPELSLPPLEPAFGTLTSLTPGTSGTDQVKADISDNLVVWSGYSDFSFDIFLYNLTSGQEIDITPDERCQSLPDFPYPGQTDPSIDGHNIVWMDGRNVYSDIYLYDLESGNEILITPNASNSNQLYPSLSGDSVVWSDDRNKGYYSYDIYLYSVATGEEKLLSPDMPNVSLEQPRIYGSHVVCEGLDQEYWTYDIYFCDVNTGVWTILTPETPWTDEKHADIAGNYIVWDGVDEINGTFDVYLYNLSSGITTTLTVDTPSTNQMNPRIEGNYVVWEDTSIDGGWDSDIVLYDISSRFTTLVSPDTTTNQCMPEISGNRIVWCGQYPGMWTWDVYLFTSGIKKPLLDTDFSANVTASRAPVTVSFTDYTQGEPAFWFWDFGDGNTSEEQNPDHTFIEPGTYDVTLRTGNPYQRAIERKEDYISAGSPPVAKFSATPQSGLSPLTVQFSDQSSGNPTVWEWDFGDNSTSTDQQPSHTYSGEGTYSISLSVTNDYGTSNLTKKNLVMVAEATTSGLNFTIPGINITESGNVQELTFDSEYVPGFSLDSSYRELTVIPPEESGIEELQFTSDSGGFTRNGTRYTGILAAVCIRSPDMVCEDSGNRGVFNYSVCMDEYPESGTVESCLWKGVFPEDFKGFDTALDTYPDYGDIHDIAYTLAFECHDVEGEAVLVIGVDSDWVSQYGEGDNGKIVIETDPAGAAIFIDSEYRGSTPLTISGLSPGPHELMLSREQCIPETRTFYIRDNRNSIKILRLCDDGSAEVLDTSFISHDPLNNRDYFSARSPDGFSRFAVSALGGPGNPIQLIYLTISKAVNSAGAGGGGTSGGTAGSPNTAAESSQATIPPTPDLPGPADTPPPLPEEPPVPGITLQPGDTSPDQESTLPSSNMSHGLLPTLPEGTASLIIMRNLSVVFVVILVTAIFYLRWQKREE